MGGSAIGLDPIAGKHPFSASARHEEIQHQQIDLAIKRLLYRGEGSARREDKGYPAQFCRVESVA